MAFVVKVRLAPGVVLQPRSLIVTRPPTTVVPGELDEVPLLTVR